MTFQTLNIIRARFSFAVILVSIFCDKILVQILVHESMISGGDLRCGENAANFSIWSSRSKLDVLETNCKALTHFSLLFRISFENFLLH